MNPLIAQIIEQMANHDGSLQSAFTATRSGPDGPEVRQGSGRMEQAHPVAGTRPQQGMGQHPVVLSREGAGPRTHPSGAEAYATGGGLTHTAGEKGFGMAINPQTIQQIMQMMMQGQQSGGGPGPVPNVPGPMTPEMVMQAMQGGGGGDMMQGGGDQMPMNPDQQDATSVADRGGQPTTEEELANVHSEMTKADPAQLTDELRQCLDDKDRKGCLAILQEMEDAGISPDKLPPDVQKQLEQEGYLDSGGDGDGPDYETGDEGDPGDHEYR